MNSSSLRTSSMYGCKSASGTTGQVDKSESTPSGRLVMSVNDVSSRTDSWQWIFHPRHLNMFKCASCANVPKITNLVWVPIKTRINVVPEATTKILQHRDLPPSSDIPRVPGIHELRSQSKKRE
jgi:hypothetical protein